MADHVTKKSNSPAEAVTSSGTESDNSVRRRKPVSIPSIDELLSEMLQLKGAVIIKAISTPNAALIQKILQAALQVQLKRVNQPGSGAAAPAGLVELCRRNPSALNVVEPFLSREQVEWLLHEIQEAPDDAP